MKEQLKNRFLFMLYAIIIGALTGLIVWTFLKIMNISIKLIWETIPNNLEIPFYTIIVCTIGGIIIGIWKKFNGDYPEDLEEVMSKVKKDGGYPYNNIGKLSISAILPLIFGGSIGPEAGLTGVIAGLCTWIGDKFKYLFKEMKELTQIGISATLGTIFNSPMFGFVAPIESEENINIPKKSKTVIYFLAIFGAFGIIILLNHLFNTTTGMPSFNSLEIGKKEWLLLIPLSIIGIIGGYVYILTNKMTQKISNPLQKFPVLKCITAGLILGILGTLLPYTMFSGEHQIEEIMKNWKELGLIILLLTAIIKLFVTNVCINLGFKGGHFFPCIFSGICLGYAVSIVLPIDPAFSVVVITTSLISFLMNKPFATMLLLMIIFPIEAIPVMLLSAVIGSAIKFK